MVKHLAKIHAVKYLCCAFLQETGRSLIHDLQSEVSGDYGKALLILAEVLSIKIKERCVTRVHFQQLRRRAEA